MRLLRLHLQAFGPFTGRILDLARGGARLALIYGPNEAGKSATLRAIGDLRFGVPQLSADNFRHAHPDMRIAGVFGSFALSFFSWAGQQVMRLLEIIFEVVAPSVMPALGLLRLSVAVSATSAVASSATIKLTEPLDWPAGIVMVVPVRK